MDKVNQTNKNYNIERLKFFTNLAGLLTGVSLTSFIFLTTFTDPNILNSLLYVATLRYFIGSLILFVVSLIGFSATVIFLYSTKSRKTKTGIISKKVDINDIIGFFVYLFLFGMLLFTTSIIYLVIYYSSDFNPPVSHLYLGALLIVLIMLSLKIIFRSIFQENKENN